MEIKGKKIGFLKTVKSLMELIDLCPGKKIENLASILSEDDSISMFENGAKIIQIMNKGYEMNKTIEDPDYKPGIIGLDDILNLPQEDFLELLSEAITSAGGERKVETEPVKKKEQKEKAKQK